MRGSSGESSDLSVLRGGAVLRENILCYNSDLFVNVKYVLLVFMPHLGRYSPNVITAWCVI